MRALLLTLSIVFAILLLLPYFGIDLWGRFAIRSGQSAVEAPARRSDRKPAQDAPALSDIEGLLNK